MNSLQKKLLVAFGISATLSVFAIILYQTDVINKLTSRLKYETKRANVAEQELAIKNKMVDELTLENQQLRDSIAGLHLEIATLNETIEQQKSAINKLNRTIKSHEEKVADLTREIGKLKNSNAKNLLKISQLEEEREKLLLKMEEYDRYRQQVMDEQAEAKRRQEAERKKLEEAQAKLQENNANQQVIAEAPPVILNQSPSAEPAPAAPSVSPEISEVIKNQQQERLMNIKTQTSVKFSEISLRKKESGNELRKIDKKDWRYTFIDFDLDNPNKEFILEELFVLQIYDLDNGLVVPMNESNPEFPESEQGNTGYKFRYKGAPVSIRYFNKQQKEGDNYEIRIFYLKGGLYFPLDMGSRRIVTNSEVIAP